MSTPADNPTTAPGKSPCPVCGGKLSRLPTVDGAGFLVVCNRCDFQRLIRAKDESQPQSPPEAPAESGQRFRKLISEGDRETQPEDWPDELLDELPPDARQALAAGPTKKADDPDQESVPGHVKRTLMDYGFAVDEDARGLRLRSAGGLRRPGTGDLSASDVVRLASELGGAPPPPEERRTCPACQAVVPRTATRCSWCDADLPPADTQSGPEESPP